MSAVVSVEPFIALQRSFIICFTVFFMLIFHNLGVNDFADVFVKLVKFFLSSIMILICLIFLSNPYFVDYKGFFINPNSFGLFSASLFISLFILVNNKNKILIFIIGLFFIGISSSRTALISFFLAMVIIFFSKFIFKHKVLYFFIFLFLILFSFLNIYVMVFLDLSSYNEIVMHYTGKNLLSGRNEVWQILIPIIQQKPFFGWGGGINIQDITYYSYSAHNAYIQYIVQVGFFGVSLIILFFAMIWLSLLKGENIYSGYSLGLIFWIFFVQNFEITFLQNNIALSLPVIILFSYFLGKSKRTIKLKTMRVFEK
ncbi:O-antigen ligase family protein [Acinetobacter johnsonii]|uniref:O-antigen ligase family protein n=1 Tax=Acinetobacter johnsonii TaxID=40214 RepID=A0AAJ6LED1_ACIJO|nr:O-antigen ligase family protein [Acinetobacter johnsonii]WMG19358.1 O-antigen ligase family protein [Acinetobacter johnsonii]